MVSTLEQMQVPNGTGPGVRNILYVLQIPQVKGHFTAAHSLYSLHVSAPYSAQLSSASAHGGGGANKNYKA